LWLHRTDLACSWVSLLLNKDATTVAFFNASIRMMLGNGESLFFWTDPWLQGTCLADIALDLTVAVGAHHHKQRSVANAFHNNNWTRDITDALTISMLLQYLDMWHRLQQVQLLLGTVDSFSWRWEPSASTPPAPPTERYAMDILPSLVPESFGRCVCQANASFSCGLSCWDGVGPLNVATDTTSVTPRIVRSIHGIRSSSITSWSVALLLVKFGSSLSLVAADTSMILRRMIQCATGGCTLGN
jgi:hypothetical protein